MAASPASIAGRAAAPARRRVSRDWLWALLFLGPNLVLFCVFTAFPIVFGLVVSFLHWNVIEPSQFVGIENYRRFFIQDQLAPKIVFNTLYFTVGVLPASILLSLLFAILLNQKIRLLAFWRGVYYLPMVTSAVAIAVVWKWLYAYQFGAVNALVRLVGIDRQDWLFSETLVMPAIIVVAIWGGLPLKIIFYLAALQGVPIELYEAAAIDGAGRWQRFVNITWPMITPTTFFLMLITIIGLMTGGFDLVWVMTQGGPLDASNLYVVQLYRTAFVYFDMGYASAMAYLLFLVILLITFVQWKFQGRWVHYG